MDFAFRRLSEKQNNGSFLCDLCVSVVTYSSFGAFQGWLLTAKDDMVSESTKQTGKHYKTGAE